MPEIRRDKLSAAIFLFVLTLAMPISGAATVLQYDDGGLELSTGYWGAAVRFTVPSGGTPCSLENLQIYFPQQTFAEQINVTIWQDVGGALSSTAMGSSLYTMQPTIGSPGWYTFDVSSAGITIPSGGGFFGGWTTIDRITFYLDNTSPDSRTLVDMFATGFLPAGFDAPIRAEVTPVPEPSGLLAILCGLGGIGGIMWRRKK